MSGAFLHSVQSFFLAAYNWLMIDNKLKNVERRERKKGRKTICFPESNKLV